MVQSGWRHLSCIYSMRLMRLGKFYTSQKSLAWAHKRTPASGATERVPKVKTNQKKVFMNTTEFQILPNSIRFSMTRSKLELCMDSISVCWWKLLKRTQSYRPTTKNFAASIRSWKVAHSLAVLLMSLVEANCFQSNLHPKRTCVRKLRLQNEVRLKMFFQISLQTDQRIFTP